MTKKIDFDILRQINTFHNFSGAESRVAKERKLKMLRAFSEIAYLFICTGKIEKAIEVLDRIERITGQEPETYLYESEKNEPFNQPALLIARFKAIQAQIELLAQEYGEIASYGGDVNAFVESESGLLLPSHKLARSRRELADEEYGNLVEQKVKEYCYPEKGYVRIVWDLASYMINGQEFGFGDVIEIISKPVDEKLLRQKMQEAKKNGLLMSSNLQFGALECLIENDLIVSVAILPYELKRQFELKEMRSHQAGQDRKLLSELLQNIIANSPLDIY